MTSVGGSNAPATTGRPARRRAVGMAAVTRRADGEKTAALATGSLAEGLVHGVGARRAISDWTTSLNRGTTAGTGSVCRSSGRSRGSGGQPGPHPTSESAPYATRTPCPPPAPGPWTPPLPWTHRARPQELGKPRGHGFPQRPPPSSSSSSRSTRKDRCPSRAHQRVSRICHYLAIVDRETGSHCRGSRLRTRQRWTNQLAVPAPTTSGVYRSHNGRLADDEASQSKGRRFQIN